MRDDNPLYVDDAYAREAGYPSVIAPPTLVCETCQYRTVRLTRAATSATSGTCR